MVALCEEKISDVNVCGTVVLQVKFMAPSFYFRCFAKTKTLCAFVVFVCQVFNENDVVHNDKVCVLAIRALFYTALIIHMLSFGGIPILSF